MELLPTLISSIVSTIYQLRHLTINNQRFRLQTLPILHRFLPSLALTLLDHNRIHNLLSQGITSVTNRLYQLWGQIFSRQRSICPFISHQQAFIPTLDTRRMGYAHYSLWPLLHRRILLPVNSPCSSILKPLLMSLPSAILSSMESKST